MEVAQFVAVLKQKDVRLSLDGDKLGVNAPKGALTDELRAELAARKEEIKAYLGVLAPVAIPPVPRDRELPASHSQRRLWFMKQMNPESSAYNIPCAMRMKGSLDTSALSRALGLLVARHEALRTHFVSREGAPWCVVSPEATLELEQIDLRHLPSQAREDEALRQTAALSERPFDLASSPLMRAALIRIASDEQWLVLVFDHIAADGLSMATFLDELQAVYTEQLTGLPAHLPALKVQYLDYAEWQRRRLEAGALQKELAYWKSALADAPPSISLPFDRPRPPVQSFRGARAEVQFPPALSTAMKSLCRAEGVTLYMALLAGFAALLHRYSSETDIVVGSVIANRNRPEIERVMGFFANNIVLRNKLDGDPTVRELLRRVRESALKAYEHQDMPFDVLVEALAPTRALDRSPIFQVMFVLQGAWPTSLELPGIRCSSLQVPIRSARFDLAMDVFDRPDGLVVYLEYATDLFDAATIERMLEHYRMLLEGMAAEPGARIAAVPLMREDAQRALLAAWRSGPLPTPEAQTVHGLFERHAKRNPDAEAVRSDGRSLAYGELDRRANQLARRLRAIGVHSGSLVGLCMNRSVELVVAMLAVLKAGAAYVPLDPSFPQDRIDFMVEDAGLAAIVTELEMADRLTHQDIPRVLLDADVEHIAALDGAALGFTATGTDLAYVIYTSGSTGKPKGVQVEHRSLVNFLRSMHREPGVGRTDRFVAVTTVSFDIAGLEIHGPLSAGGTVVLASRETALDGQALAELLEASHATILQATPATWRLLLDTGWTGRKGLKMLCGGEALPPELAERLLALDGELWNLYGPTETTVWSSVQRVREATHPIPIGRPIADTALLVLEPSGQLAPVGVPGELCIGGAGVARGYLNRPELTAAKFTSLRVGGSHSERVYRTGDLARIRADGKLEFIGRRDHQVKVRGFRIELGEIEATIASHPSVRQAVVITRDRPDGDRRLLAYVVLETATGATSTELRGFLHGLLPEYMIPSAFVALDRVPLTPNGKVDRAALPDPSGTSMDEERHEAAADGTEQAVADIWCNILGIARVGRHDDFFEAGGHSLLATQVISRVRDVFGVKMAVRTLFEASTLMAFAHRIDTARREGDTRPAPAIVARAHSGPTRLSFSQERMWVIQSLAPESRAYNMPGAMRLHGPLDVKALEDAFDEMRARHEILRTTYRLVDGVPMQEVRPHVKEPLLLVDLASYGVDAIWKARHAAEVEAAKPFDLATGPVIRAVLYRLADDDHVFAGTVHHIAGDQWSFGVLGRELATLYNARRRGVDAALAPLPLSYRDFSAWQRDWLQGDELERQTSYWVRQLQDVPPVDLVTDHPRPLFQGFRGRQLAVRLADGFIGRIEEAARREGSTLFMMAYAAFAALLHRLTGQEDFAIGVPIANRTHSVIEPLLGTFVNTLAMRADLSGDPSFGELLRRVRQVALDAYAHQDAPFELLVDRVGRRDTSRAPIVQVMLNVQNAPMRGIEFDGLHWKPLVLDRGAAQFELALTVDTEITRSVMLEYNSELFEEATMNRLVEQYLHLLAGAVADPRERIASLSLLPPSQQRQLREWNDASRTEHGSVSTYPRLFEARARAAGSQVAVSFEGTSITYADLNARANRLARRLQASGVQAGSLVGVCLDRGIELCVALLAVQKAGAGYVPLDPMFPQDRLEYMLEDSGALVLLTGGDAASAIDVPAGVATVDVLAADDVVTVSADDLSGDPSPADPAYVIYTSGSTGRPKGVVVPHGALTNFLHSMRQQPGLKASDVLAAVTTISFDIAGLELYLPWLVGARVELVGREAAADGAELARVLGECGATVLQATPATWRLLLEADWRPPAGFRALCGGEALPRDLAERLLERVDELWNMYGPTETTVWSTVERVQRGPGEITVGRPIANTQVHVLDRKGQLVPVGVPGEICIGGAGVALGYHRRPELTAEKFIADPFCDVPGARLYRTGDLGRWRADGRLEHLGRLDHQVKIRGFRIELGEIETVLQSHEAVKQCVVVAREAAPGDLRLVAYVVYEPGEELTVSEVRRHLRGGLPDYMIPSMVVALDTIPLTPNGKVDRKALPDPFKGAAQAPVGYVAPAEGAEQALADIWREILRVERVGAEDNFFELGGHSLLSLRVAAAVQARFGTRMDPRALFFQNLRQVAASVGQAAMTAQVHSGA
jgi:amino acid adenylation domain-containing protein